MTLIIRTDANSKIGTGHVFRCLALAQAWLDAGGDVIFSMSTQPPWLEERLEYEGIKIANIAPEPGSLNDASRVIELAKFLSTPYVVVDGYHFDAKYQLCLKEAGLFLIFIDDYGHADYYWADLVLNQNIYAHTDLYNDRAPYTRLLLGPRYALLRCEFNLWQEWERKIYPLAHRVLVTLGGGDPGAATLKVIDALQQVNVADLEVVVVTGMGHLQNDELSQAVKDSQIHIRLDNMVLNMPELMAWADVAISAAGGTSWELAFMGLPSILVVLSDNQEPVAKALDSAGVARNLGRLRLVDSHNIAEALQSLLEDQEARRRMSRQLREIVDSRGASRVISAIRSIV